MLEYINENIGFFLKVVFTHVITYMVCGMVSYKINNYKDWLEKNQVFNWRDKNSLIFNLAPVFQILRGILFGIVLLLIKDSIIDINFGFLKLFVILTILGLFNVYSPAPASIEEFIYVKPLPPENLPPKKQQIGAILEIMIQIFIFSIIVCTNWTELFNKIFK